MVLPAVRILVPIVVAAVACMVPAQTLPQVESGPSDEAAWFVSDSDLIRRDPATPEELRQSRWTVAVDMSAAPGERTAETAWLFRAGEPVASERTIFSRDGLPLERRRTDNDGQPLFIETYRYRSDGSLREARRCDSDDRCVTILYGFPAESWDESVLAPEYRAVHLYDRQGRPEYILREEDGATEEEEWLTYDGPDLSVRRVRRNGEERTLTYEDGRVVSEVERRNGRLLREVTRRFDNGRIAEEIVQSGGSVRRDIWLYERDGADDGTEDGAYRKTREVDGVKTLEERRDGTGTGVTIRYEDGQEVVREYFRDGELQRREIIVNGRAVRTDEQ
jgi:hypothetical protein